MIDDDDDMGLAFVLVFEGRPAGSPHRPSTVSGGASYAAMNCGRFLSALRLCMTPAETRSEALDASEEFQLGG